MYPGNSFDIDLLKEIINKAYWPIYGEIKLLEDLDKNCTDTDASCPKLSGKYYSFMALIVYMIIGKVLI